jgi:hypothetical protein
LPRGVAVISLFSGTILLHTQDYAIITSYSMSLT